MPLPPIDRRDAAHDDLESNRETPSGRLLPRRRRTGVRAVAMAVAAAAVVLAASGCGPVNAGSGAADRFEDWMAGTENVADVYASGTNDLPFTGTAGGTVVLEPDLSPDDVATVVERAVTFSSRPSVSVSIEYTAGDFVAIYGVSRTDRAHNADLDAFARALDTGTSATHVDILVRTDSTGIDSMTIVAEGPDDFLAGFDDVRAVAVDHSTLPVSTTFTSTDSGFTVSAGIGGDAHASRAVYTTVAATYPLIGAVLADDAVELRVEAARTPDVATLAGTVSGGIPVSVQFENITRVGEGDFAAAELITATARGAASVLTVQEQAEEVEVVVRDLASALAVDAAVGELPETGTALTLRTEDGRFVLNQQWHGYDEYAQVLVALDALGAAVEEVDVRKGLFTVEVTDDVDLAAVGTVLAVAPRSCPAIAVTVRGAYSLALAPARPLTAADVTVAWGDPIPTDAVPALVAGWNAGA